jgi:aerobic C4-dicarboxylate transport protein
MTDMLRSARRDHDVLRQQSEAFDRELMADMRQVGGEKYARLAALAYRQTLAAHKLVADVDGTAMYLTMASLFISNALGMPLSWSEQLSLLVFMIVASKGAAGVTGAGLAVLGGGLASHAPALVPGVGLVVAVDRFMSEARALTNFSGNAVATLVIGHWVKEIDRPQANRVFTGEDPFDDTDMLDEHSAEEHRADATAYKKTKEISATH